MKPNSNIELPNKRTKILFVTWDGPQVSYLEGLFLPIFKALKKSGFDFHILQFTWGDPQQVKASRQACIESGFTYQAKIIWRHPVSLGGLLTALDGARVIRKAIRDHQIDVLMPRSTLPALATLLALRGSSLPMIFDADGLPLDERVDFAGQSPSSFVYRLLRDIEAQTVRRADVVLTRSAKAVEILHARSGAGTSAEKFHVVVNGRDVEQFQSADATASANVRLGLGLSADTPLLVYAGSMGRQYCIDEMLRLFTLIYKRKPDAHFLILTGSPEYVQPVLDKHQHLRGCVTALSMPAKAVPQYLGCADLGLALRQPSFSMQAIAPIKLGEYLLCGLPVVATAGIGDADAISTDAGILLLRMDDAELNAVADWFINSVLPYRDIYRANSRAIGLSRFSLEASAASYVQALEHLVCLPKNF
jgi:glycosyltransferase involved in cell wall biosynthesis